MKKQLNAETEWKAFMQKKHKLITSHSRTKTSWTINFDGESGSCWEGYNYSFTLDFSEYPFLSAKFTPPIPHPNNNSSGEVCFSYVAGFDQFYEDTDLVMVVNNIIDQYMKRPNYKAGWGNESTEIIENEVNNNRTEEEGIEKWKEYVRNYLKENNNFNKTDF